MNNAKKLSSDAARTGFSVRRLRQILKNDGDDVRATFMTESTTTWVAGDGARYWGSPDSEPIQAGLFFYAGFGMGRYFSSDGKVYD